MNNHLATMVATPSTIGDESWYMDTGATHHLTPNLNKLNSHTPFVGSDKVMVGNDLWHFRLGHLARKIVNKVLSACSLPPEHWTGVCEPCQMAKSHRLPFTLSESRASQPFALVHSDLWGPTPVVGTNGARYFVLFVDDHTRFSWLYLLASKDQAISAFLQFKVMIETQFDTKVRMLQTDWGGEFQAFTNTLCKFGILHRVSCPSTSQQNGRVERKHRHVG
ncbi:Retrovirus-related Pol polyprotein from transposon RE2 [Vitis vinifera]|uniref:Retrovirus-related Pol polyprotein from transposon RE2 n=1 Tax=Vitis vinifera TaxID=29760 RepID=A0A438C9J0_VITVI|nr:Retrovirus-related Pol polyprotein from transposon RE2 [Vitis vinifera]